ncbi:MAG: hypothetical protein H6922_06155 [Pseudomonadaceae bacterium]|nr:hypothetical protein [Pseudomonadaceae bacterium]
MRKCVVWGLLFVAVVGAAYGGYVWWMVSDHRLPEGERVLVRQAQEAFERGDMEE